MTTARDPVGEYYRDNRPKAVADVIDTADAAAVLATPVGFAEHYLKKSLYQWQAVVLSWFESTAHRVKGSLCTPNGAGKSERVIATLVLWWLSVHPKGIVVITSKDSKQLDFQIWPALEAHKERFPHWDFIERNIRNNTGGFCIGFTTDEAGRAEGWHKLDDVEGPLLIICDEAKSIPDSIFEAFDRCTYNAILYTSSPGLNIGRFYDSQTRLAEAPDRKGFKHMAVGLADCPHIPQERIDDVIATYGADHPFTLSTLHGKFMDADASSMFVFQNSAVTACMDPKRPPTYVHGRKSAFCDFAAGRNENVCAIKEGNRIRLECWKDPDPMRAVLRFISIFVREGLSPSDVDGDEGGMGIAIIARFRELNWPINPVNNSEKALEPDKFENRGAEMWHGAARVVEGQGIILPDDPVLKAQLTSRKIKLCTGERLGVESKKDMADRGLESPDRADAVVGVVAREVHSVSTFFDADGLARLDAMARPSSPTPATLVDSGDAIAFEANPATPWFKTWERPATGCSYVVVVNPARHSEPLLDHVVIVLRAGYYDDDARKEVPARVVAKFTSRLDAGPLAERIRLLGGWYGDCYCVPVTNDRGDIIDKLCEAGVALHAREQLENLKPGNRALMFGWETNDFTRSLWIGALTEAIRENSVDVEDSDTVMQLFRLSANNSETMRAAEALGVGLKCLQYATTYVPKRRTSPFAGMDAPRSQRSASKSMIS